MKRYTISALSRVLNMPESEIRTLTRQGIIQKGVTEGNLYDIENTAREIIDFMRKPNQRIADYQAERAKFMRAKRQNAEYDLKTREKELHTSEDLELIISKILVGFKARIRSIPARISPQLSKMNSQEDIFDLLKTIMDEALQELSDIDTVFSLSEQENNK